MPSRREGRGHTASSPVPLESPSISFPFFSPLLLAKADSWPSVLSLLLQMLQAKAAQADVAKDAEGSGVG